MFSLKALIRTLPLAAFVLGAFVLGAFVLSASLGLSVVSVDAQENTRRGDGQGLFKKPNRGPAIGGTSWTLSDVWGEPEMPEPSRDYPGYDYPPGGYNLNGGPSQSPYPN